MSFTNDEIALIEGIISELCTRMSGDSLRKSFAILHQHLQEGFVNQIDLQRIDRALAFVDPGKCVSGSIENYYGLLSLRVKTAAMLDRV